MAAMEHEYCHSSEESQSLQAARSGLSVHVHEADIYLERNAAWVDTWSPAHFFINE